LSAYREGFRPSRLLSQPQVMLAVGIICAETEEEAMRLSVEAESFFRPAAADQEREEGRQDGREKTAASRKLIIGTPEQVKAKLDAYAEGYGVDEFLVVTAVPNYEKRLRSYELLAQTVLG
jgi:alkanesulfonate monooxygenase SsuD/methylene tetrahydromethanopterin reductase-like flavin-dependent oxidoreductase (luciferase family)